MWRIPWLQPASCSRHRGAARACRAQTPAWPCRGYNSYYIDWVMKLRSAWIFLLLAFLLWMASMFLAALVLEQVKRRPATASKAPDYPEPGSAKIKQKDSTSPVVSAGNIV